MSRWKAQPWRRYEFNVPFTIIRTISDTANHNAHVDFNRFIAEVASGYSRAIFGEIAQLL